jgi:murein endopeptidase
VKRVQSSQRVFQAGLALILSAVSLCAGSTLAHAENSEAYDVSSGLVEDWVAPQNEAVPLDFCEEWNPEFQANDYRCCGRVTGYSARGRRGRKSRPRCDVHRNRQSYCDEITPEQKEYIAGVNSGKIADLLEYLSAQVEHRPIQAYCSVNTGFLVHGRAIVPTSENLIKLRSPQRCTYFGTEPMVAMLEWLGRQVKKEIYPENPGIHILLGDVAAPRGGCLAAMGGRRGHKSHMVGQDADIGLLTPRGKKPSPDYFHRDLQAKPNWWFVKQIFQNPYACIKMIFLDRRQISKLARAAAGDPEWAHVRRFIRHFPGHRDHFHVRIGDGPGEPGCSPNANPDDELDEDESEAEEAINLDTFDRVKSTSSHAAPAPGSVPSSAAAVTEDLGD